MTASNTQGLTGSNNFINNNPSSSSINNLTQSPVEANTKSDAECLNNMVATMASNLNITNTDILEVKLATTGNIFYTRDEWSILNKLPAYKQNPMHIRLEDEGPYGNDDTRCFILSYFSKLCIRQMKCSICLCDLLIYDRFPIVDGTLFVSPIKYIYDDKYNEMLNDKNDNNSVTTVPANISNRNQFIYAICLDCLHSTNEHKINCKSCKKPWSGGSSIQIGTLYKYEIFAAFPCCQKRLNCNNCDKQIINLKSTGGLPYFSSYSEEKECPHCKIKSFHFIKHLNQFYDIEIGTSSQ